MKCNLGRIVNNEMNLSDFGKIVEQEWFRSFEIRNELILHEFVVMPNHLHAIVEICNDNGDELSGDDMDVNNIVAGDFTAVDEFAIDDYSDEMVQTHGRVSLRQNPPSRQNPNPPQNPNPRQIPQSPQNPNSPQYPHPRKIHFIIHGRIQIRHQQ